MIRCSDPFPSQRQGFNLETLETDPHSIFAMDAELKRVSFNPGWVRCARENGGEAALWDWVPAWVERMPAATRHGLCPVCEDNCLKRHRSHPARRHGALAK